MQMLVFLFIISSRLSYLVQSEHCPGDEPQLAGPTNVSVRESWLANLRSCRTQALKKINYHGGVFNEPRNTWTQTAFAIPMVQGYDRFLYDEIRGEYTVSRYLDDVRSRYGGVDAILLWPTYTNLGLDDRNQIDMYRAMPGGIDGVKNITKEFHDAGVKVLWSYNPWDTGTHREVGWYNVSVDDPLDFSHVLKHAIADGINGDTMHYVPEVWWNDSLIAGWPLAFQPEGGGSVQSLNWETMSVCHCKYTNLQQTVDHYKWLDPRRMTSVRDRWSSDHTDALHFSWFNGVGFETTESNWGDWNGLTAHDAEAIKRMFTVLRYFARCHLLQSPDWIPHINGTKNPHVFASTFPSLSNNGDQLWLLVNRANTTYTGGQLILPLEPTKSKLSLTKSIQTVTPYQYFDCWRGDTLTISNRMAKFVLPSRGFGCVLRTKNSTAHGTPLGTFLEKMKSLTAKGPLSSFSRDFHPLMQNMIPVTRTPAPVTSVTVGPRDTAGMVLIPSTESFLFKVRGVEDQGSDKLGADVQYYWEAQPFKEHRVSLPIRTFLLDRTPVTGAQFNKFLTATGYRPTDVTNFLKNWNGSHTCPAGLLTKPVTYVSLAEARTYCKWAGKRLPHEWEWQYAAQGLDGREYPWGNNLTKCGKAKECIPPVVIGRRIPGPNDVEAHSPQGDSIFGVADLIGNVWQMTTEFVDAHSRGVVVRGSSNYQAGINGKAGSHWYFPAARELSTHNEYMLMSDSYDRAGTLGFRCAQDVYPDPDNLTKCSVKTVQSSGVACGRWSGPPLANTTLPTVGSSVMDWAHWFLDNGSVKTVRPMGTIKRIGIPRPLPCPGTPNSSFFPATTGTVAFNWRGGTPIAEGTAIRNGLGTSCGFELNVMMTHDGVETLAIYGGAGTTVSINVTGSISNSTHHSFTKIIKPISKNKVSDFLFHVEGYGGGENILNIKFSAINNMTPPSNVTSNYTQYRNLRCGDGQGAINLDGNKSIGGPGLSPTECMSFCDKDIYCSCVQYDPDSGRCWRRARCVPDHCLKNPNLTLFMKDFIDYPNVNCFQGHGAHNIDNSPVENQSVHQCQMLCEGDDTCTAVVYRFDKRWCWRRNDVILAKCEHNANNDHTFMKPSSSFSSTQIFLYAATFIDGDAPPLLGFI